MKKDYLLIFFVSFFILLVIPLLTTEIIDDQSELKNVKFGFPLKYISQSISIEPDEEYYPFEVNMFSPWENPTKILISNFLISWLVVFLALLLIGKVIAILRKLTKKL